jgi:predicted dehydrogenase
MSVIAPEVPREILNVAVVGVGRMGHHHARTYHKLEHAKLVGLVDADIQRAQQVAEEFGTRAFASVDELLAHQPTLHAATVAVPTRRHADAAKPLLQRGIACLIEKPLAGSSSEARALADFARECDAVIQVGHTERFNPAVRALSAMPLNPRFIEVDRVSPMTFRSLDVGVVMDMMIHDLDIVLMLARSPITSVEATGVKVLGEHEDVCNARITFASGCVANITASRLSLKTERKLRLLDENTYVSLDYQKRSGLVLRKSANRNQLREVKDKLRSGEDLSALDFARLVSTEKLAMDLPEEEHDSLTAQLTTFLHAAAGKSPPVVSAQDGVAAVDAAERVVHAAREHHWVGLDEPAVRI